MKIEVSGQFRSYNRHEGVKNKLVLSIFVRELRFIEDEDIPEEQSKSNQIFHLMAMYVSHLYIERLH